MTNPAPPPLPSSTVPPSQPVQPPLVGTLISGILTYCGLIVAGMAALMATDRFSDLNYASKIAMCIATLAALGGGPLALFSMSSAVNYAKRVGENENTNKIAFARFLMVFLGNCSLFCIIVSTTAAAWTIWNFGLCVHGPEAVSESNLIEFQAQPAIPAITLRDMFCYPRPEDVNSDMPAQICVLGK